MLVFAKADRRELRRQNDLVTRDNVLLEFQLFMGELGWGGVWILEEKGVDISGAALGQRRTVSVEQVRNSVRS